MPKLRTSLVALSVGILAGTLSAQPGAAPAAVKGGVLERIPASAVAFVVVKNVKGLTGEIDSFLAEGKLADVMQVLLKDKMDDGALRGLTTTAKLGKGFDAGGGFAAALLDPQLFGADIMQLLPLPPMLTDSQAKPKKKPKLPFVVFVPGKSIQGIFGKYKMTPGKKNTRIQLRIGEVFARQIGNHVVLSPLPKALDAVAESKKSIAAELPAAKRAILSAAPVAVHVNMKKLGPKIGAIAKFVPLLMKMNAPATKPAKGEDEEGGALQMFSGARDGIIRSLAITVAYISPELDAFSLIVRPAKSHLIIETLLTFKPESTYAKFYAPGGGGSVLARVPNLTYGLAIGASATTVQGRKKSLEEPPGSLMPALLGKIGISKAEIPKVEKMFAKLGQEAITAQVSGGGPPGKAGVFGVDVLVTCEDTAKFKALLAETAATVESALKASDKKQAGAIKIAYKPAALKIGQTTVDAVTIAHPNLTGAPKDERAVLAKALGEPDVRILVASPDKKTVILTFGGGAGMMAKALATAAAGNGRILADPATAAVMKHLPAKCVELTLVNLGNAAALYANGAKKLEDEDEDEDEGGNPLGVEITCKTPVAIGVGMSERTKHTVIYVPSGLFKDFAELLASLLMSAMPEPDDKLPPEAGDNL